MLKVTSLQSQGQNLFRTVNKQRHCTAVSCSGLPRNISSPVSAAVPLSQAVTVGFLSCFFLVLILRNKILTVIINARQVLGDSDRFHAHHV